ncbi:hypothetical protein NC651_009981 [Populus alba x Populus x berolinensis]|nr:hypothetical protein NC651_009981 [Populus alba x Populus x berolinensis]
MTATNKHVFQTKGNILRLLHPEKEAFTADVVMTNGTSGIVFQTSLDLARMRSPKFRRIISDSGLSDGSSGGLSLTQACQMEVQEDYL